MPRTTRLDIARQDIESLLDRRGPRAYSGREIAQILEENRSYWRLAQRTSVDDFVEFLENRTRKLTPIAYVSQQGRRVVRYAWSSPSDTAVALSLAGPTAYVSHASAIFLHGLSDLIPRMYYINEEQTPKPSSPNSLTQDALDRAFASTQRVSHTVYESSERPSVAILNGKYSGGLEVTKLAEAGNAPIRVASIERTLIDTVVRPAYAGGINNVLDAYRAARDRVSVTRLRATLEQLAFIYPYRQSIGFLLERAGYPERRYEEFRVPTPEFDFYLVHGSTDNQYDSRWRLYYPRGLGG